MIKKIIILLLNFTVEIISVYPDVETIFDKVNRLKETITSNPKDYNSILTLVETYIENGNYYLAGEEIKSFHKMVDELPKETQFRYYRTMAKYFSTQKNTIASNYFKKANNIKKDINLNIEYGNFLFSINNFKDAINIYNNILENFTNLNETQLSIINYYLGSAYIKLHDYSKAKFFLDKSLSYDKNSPLTLEGFGALYFYLHDYSLAEKFLLSSLSVSKDNRLNSRSYDLLSKIAINKYNYELYKRSLEFSLKIDSSNLGNMIRIANLINRYDTKDKSEEYYKKIIINYDDLLKINISNSEKADYLMYKANDFLKDANYNEAWSVIKILYYQLSSTDTVINNLAELLNENIAEFLSIEGLDGLYNFVKSSNVDLRIQYKIAYQLSEFFLIQKKYEWVKKFAEVCFLKHNIWSKQFTPPAIYRVNDSIKDDKSFISYCENILKNNNLNINIECRIRDILAHRYCKINEFQKAISEWDYILKYGKERKIKQIARSCFNRTSQKLSQNQ